MFCPQGSQSTYALDARGIVAGVGAIGAIVARGGMVAVLAGIAVLLGAEWTESEADGMANPRPQTIPALREWTGGSGTFRLRRRPRIVVPRRYRRRLRSTARVFARDLARLTGRRVRVVTRRGVRPRRGDIQLLLRARNPALGREGYRLRVGRSIGIRGRKAAGVFYGTRTVLQLLRQGPTIPRGRARDWPRYRNRGLMIDNGRKYFTPRWIESHIRELAYLKLNRLHLHFSDNQGFRIESESHPEIVSRDHLTKAEVRRILALARRYHVTVVPELDMPGHMQAVLARHPELQLRDATGRRDPDKLDVSLPAARRFARELIEEYTELFPAREWHGGADEYLFPAPEAGYALYPQLQRYARERYGERAEGKDAYLDFINWMNEVARARGKRLRIWHDGLTGGIVRVRPEIVVEWWTDHAGPRPQELLARGHRILNAGWFPTYYVEGPLGAVRPDMRTAYESWEPNEFYGPFVANETLQNPPDVVSPDEPRNLGSELHVWNDDPEAETEAQIAAGIHPRLRVLAQKTWASRRLTAAYADFRPVMNAVGNAPGYDVR
jgi:hexosaminidase